MTRIVTEKMKRFCSVHHFTAPYSKFRELGLVDAAARLGARRSRELDDGERVSFFPRVLAAVLPPRGVPARWPREDAWGGPGATFRVDDDRSFLTMFFFMTLRAGGEYDIAHYSTTGVERPRPPLDKL